MTNVLGLCAGLLLGGLLATGAVQAQAVCVPGTAVRLVPPEGFTPAVQFPGFHSDDLQASIMVTEMPGSAAEIDNLQAFSHTRARQTAQMKDVRNFKGHFVKVEGLDAYELVADAKDARSGTPMTIYQVIVPDVTGYFIVQGVDQRGTGGGGAAGVQEDYRHVSQGDHAGRQGGIAGSRRRPSLLVVYIWGATQRGVETPTRSEPEIQAALRVAGSPPVELLPPDDYYDSLGGEPRISWLAP